MSNSESFADLFEKSLRSVKEGEVVSPSQPLLAVG